VRSGPGLAPRPRAVDWTILAALTLALATGLLSLTAGSAGDAWLVVLHGIGGLALVVLVYWKLRRVWPRLAAAAGDRTVALSALLAAMTLAVLATGVAWALGAAPDLWGWTLLTLHAVLGVLIVPLALYHLLRRARPPTRADWEGRRTALQYAGLAAVGALAYRGQEALTAALGTTGADRRFTGSNPEGGTGNRFPVTNWMLDDPDPIDAGEWRLRVVGRVERPLALGYGDLPTVSGESGASASDGIEAGAGAGNAAGAVVSAPAAVERATLDCTSGWYVERDWQGVRVGALLDAAGPAGDGRFVTFRSVTGYRFGVPLSEARDVVLATHVDGERLTHGHGFPLRVVAPERRGFQWVKWVDAVEVRERPDPGQWLAIFLSGVDAE
jgi:DMSO/TMAO reductase YedYZ molybdopterin-dependent catalytic subunit